MGLSTCVLIVVGGRCGDRRRQAACTPWVDCRGEERAADVKFLVMYCMGIVSTYIRDKQDCGVGGCVGLFDNSERHMCFISDKSERIRKTAVVAQSRQCTC
jgi:hypothetical protein